MGAALGLGLRDGRRGGLDRHLGHRVRGRRETGGRPDRAGVRVRRRDRPVPAAACTINAARVLDVTARMLGIDAAGLSDLALAAPARGGRTDPAPLPGRRADPEPARRQRRAARAHHAPTPRRRTWRGRRSRRCSARWPTRSTACGRADRPGRVVLTGGAARSEAVRQIAPAIFGLPVDGTRGGRVRGARRGPAGGLGAVRHGRAAGLAAGRTEATRPPRATPEVRERYASLRDDAAAWHR